MLKYKVKLKNESLKQRKIRKVRKVRKVISILNNKIY